MIYDFDLSIAGCLLFAVLYFLLTIRYDNTLNSVKQLKILLLGFFVADILDIVTGITISYSNIVPLWVNYLLNTIFFELVVICMYLYPKYARYIIDPEHGRKNHFDRINDCLVVLYGITCASSFITHSNFYFDESRAYVHGPLYLLGYLLPLYFMLYTLFLVFTNKKSLSNQQIFSCIGFTFVGIGGTFIQMCFFSSHLVIFFSLSIAMFIVVMALETPEYIKLEATLKDLKHSQEALKDAVIRAESADQAKSDFLANMSHEIRTPINAVLGMNELISRESTEETILTYSSNVADAGNALLSLINDILDFSKIEAGHMELTPANYELTSLIREVNNIISIRCTEKGLKLNITCNPDTPNLLYGDEVRIRQILINILNNALKYTDEGSVTLCIDYEPVEDDKIMLILKAKDTGIGIKQDDITNLFDAFKRIDPAHNRKREGTGLGLSITKSFVDMMGGTINVDSVYGEGSEFTIRIPQLVKGASKTGIVTDSLTSNKKSKYKASFKASDARILVVDDVAMNLKVIKGLLKQTGIIVDTASSGAECLELIRDTRYNLIFLDHMMPEMDGLETKVLIDNDDTHANKNTPIIMLTANAIIGAKDEYIDAGFTDYLAKPVKSQELEAMLIKYLPAELIVTA